MTPAQLEVRHRFVDLPGLRLHLVEKGQGPLVVLLHGFPECWWSWRHQIEPLAKAGFRVVAPDLRGYGETDKQGPFDLDTVCGDVASLIAALGEKSAHVVGHDWGGAAAWHLASRWPQVVNRLAVLNCPHPAVMREAFVTRPNLRQLRKSWYMFFFQLPLLPEWMLRRHGAAAIARALRGNAIDRTHFGDEEIRPFLEAALRPGALTAMLGWYRAAIRDGLAHPLTAPNYPVINAETLLVWAQEDTALGFHDLVPGTEKWAPRLTIEPIENCGHFVHAERPDQVTPLLIRHLAG